MLENVKEKLLLHKMHAVFAVVSLLGVILAIVPLFIVNMEPNSEITYVHAEDEPITDDSKNEELELEDLENIFVDISGAVKKPGMYKMTAGSRLSEVLDKAGGLSGNADADYFARNYNISRTLADQEKIYIPRLDEVSNGVFIEGRYIINHSIDRVDGSEENAVGKEDPNNQGLTNINTASQDELEELPGIGPVTAEKIIQGRPYAKIDDLVEKEVIGEAAYQKIKSLIAY